MITCVYLNTVKWGPLLPSFILYSTKHSVMHRQQKIKKCLNLVEGSISASGMRSADCYSVLKFITQRGSWQHCRSCVQREQIKEMQVSFVPARDHARPLGPSSKAWYRLWHCIHLCVYAAMPLVRTGAAQHSCSLSCKSKHLYYELL